MDLAKVAPEYLKDLVDDIRKGGGKVSFPIYIKTDPWIPEGQVVVWLTPRNASVMYESVKERVRLVPGEWVEDAGE